MKVHLYTVCLSWQSLAVFTSLQQHTLFIEYLTIIIVSQSVIALGFCHNSLNVGLSFSLGYRQRSTSSAKSIVCFVLLQCVCLLSLQHKDREKKFFRKKFFK